MGIGYRGERADRCEAAGPRSACAHDTEPGAQRGLSSSDGFKLVDVQLAGAQTGKKGEILDHPDAVHPNARGGRPAVPRHLRRRLADPHSPLFRTASRCGSSCRSTRAAARPPNRRGAAARARRRRLAAAGMM
jgi:hypothetical protein